MNKSMNKSILFLLAVCVLLVVACSTKESMQTKDLSKSAGPSSASKDSSSAGTASMQDESSNTVDASAKDISGSVSEVDSMQQDSGTDSMDSMDSDLASIDSADWG